MALDLALQATAANSHLGSFATFAAHIDPSWIEEALEATGTATLRRRRLPAEQVIWLVLGIALFRDRSIKQVVENLDLALPSPQGGVAGSAIPKARARLGAEPMKWLFERSGRKWGHESADRHRWRGLSLYGLDGSSLRLADTEENVDTFGRFVSGGGESSNPMLRLVVLMALRSHLLVSASFGPYAATSELAHAQPLLSEIPPRSLTIVDALYLSAALLLSIEHRGESRHWMLPAKTNTKMRVVEERSATDSTVEMVVSADARAKDPSLPATWLARAIRYQRAGHAPRILLTSLLDHVAFPEDELSELYHERWELELAYDELKTEMLDAQITLRSKSPTGVQQELWGTLIGFNLIRLEMERIAAEARVAPTRISFVAALHFIRDEINWSASSQAPGAIPKKLLRMRDLIRRFVLPPRRPKRSYPREIKNDYRRYPRRKTALGAK